jgi:ATP-dependent DNA helicase RecG
MTAFERIPLEEPIQLSFGFSPLVLLSADEIYLKADPDLLTQLFEDRRIERKPPGIHSRALGDYFSMWANTSPDGGILVVGMEDDGRYSGLSSLGADALNDLERSGWTYCPDSRYESKRVAVTNVAGQPDFVLMFRIPYRSDKLIRTVSGEAFVRVGDAKRKLNSDEAREIEIDKGQLDLEQETGTLKYPQDLDLDLIHQFANGVRKKKDLDDTHRDLEILEQRRLGKRKGNSFLPNVACELMFAKDPVIRFPGCKIRFLRFDGEHEGTGDKFNAVKDIWLEGPVPKLIVAAETTLDSQLRTFNRLGPDGKFYTAPEYPKLAWYEAIVNAVVHRSYGLRNMNIFVKMFDDRLVIESPGGLPPLVTPENIYNVHHPRNPNLMDAMYYLDFVKAANEGTRRMRDTMSQVNLPLPEFEVKEVGHAILRVTLRNNIKQRKVWIDSDVGSLIGAAIAKDLNQDERRALNFVAEHGSISVSQLQRLTGRSWPSAKKLLAALGHRGIVEQKKRSSLDRDPQARFFLKIGKTDKD